MRKQLLFLAVALAMCGAPLTSCQKDDEPNQSVQDVSVANTMWRGDDGTTFKFYSNGTFEFSWKWAEKGEYSQIGNEINMIGQTVWYNDHIYNLRYAYVTGNSMRVEMFRALISQSTINVTFNKVK